MKRCRRVCTTVFMSLCVACTAMTSMTRIIQAQEGTEDPPAHVEKAPDIEYPAFDHVLSTDNGTEIQIHAPEGAFPEGIQVHVQNVDPDLILQDVQNQNESIQIKTEDLLAYHFDFYTSQSHQIEPLLPVTISIKNRQLQGKENLSLYHIGDTNESKPITSFDAQTGVLSFQTDTFSIYALLMHEESPLHEEGINTTITDADKQPDEASSPDATTDFFASDISLAEENDSFYGGDIFNVYNHIAISGNETILEEGAYTLISLSKTSFEKPSDSDVSTAFDSFKALEISETESDYQIKISYSTLYGGYNADTPIRLSLKKGRTINNSQHSIKQEFFNKDGTKLTSDHTLIVKGRADIDPFTVGSSGKGYRMTGILNPDYTIKEGSIIELGYMFLRNVGFSKNHSDPRDRRVFLTVPEGTKIKEGTGWTLEKETGRYYRDFTQQFADQPNEPTIIYLDVSGVDMSPHDSPDKLKKFAIQSTTVPVVDGEVQTDLGPYPREGYRQYYILKNEPDSPPTYGGIVNLYEYIQITQNYERKNKSDKRWSNDIEVSYNRDLLEGSRVRYKQDVFLYLDLRNSNDRNDRELKIKFKNCFFNVGPRVDTKEIRLMIEGLSDKDSHDIKERLKGTKAYIYHNGEKKYVSEDVPIVSYSDLDSSFTDEGWQPVDASGTSEIYFEFPSSFELNGDEETRKFGNRIHVEAIGDIKEYTYNTLKKYLDQGDRSFVYDELRANTTYEISMYRYPTDSKMTTLDIVDYSNLRSLFFMHYQSVYANMLRISSASTSIYSNEKIDITSSYTYKSYGNPTKGLFPKNLYLYYLVPDGLEPVEDQKTFESIEVMRGYKDNMNLVIAKPKNITIRSNNWTVENKLTFNATTRLDTGDYTLYSCMILDNNKIGIDENGEYYGIKQFDKPSGPWENILTDGKNRPDSPSYSDFKSVTFRVLPPKVLSAKKEVKLSSEEDKKYSSSLGARATIGDEIDYRWVFNNAGTREVNNLEVIDVLPHQGDKAIVPNDFGEYISRNSEFKTPLVSVEENEKFDIFYSTDPVKNTTGENYRANWVKSVEDVSKVTMVKAVLKKGQTLGVGEIAYVVMHHKIENNPEIQDGQKAFNSFAYTLNEGTSFTEVLKTEARVSYPKRDVLVEKVDLTDPNIKLANASFHVYEEGTDALIFENLTTNRDGIATIPNLLIGKKYYLQEISAPNGYVKSDQKVPFTVEEVSEEIPVQKIIVTNDVPRISIRLTKKWIGKPSVDEVTVHVLANGTDTGITAVLKADEDWNTIITGLPENDSQGLPIQYTLKEEEGDSYTSSISGNQAEGFVLTNTNIQKRSIPVNKTWIGPQESKAVFTLVQDGVITEKTLTLNENTGWHGSFDDLIKYDPVDGHEIEYTVEESPVDHYAISIEGNMNDGFHITNTNNETIEIPVHKKWIGPSKDKVEVILFIDGKPTENILELTAQNNWIASFKGLRKYDSQDGHALEYTVQEASVDGYTSQITGDMNGYEIVNTNVQTINIPVYKVWVGPSQKEAVITLYKDGASTDQKVVLNANNQWTDTFFSLARYDHKDGHEIMYTVQETSVENYSSSITCNMTEGFTVTNTCIETINIPVRKVWVGPIGQSAAVSLYRDGDLFYRDMTLSAVNGWQDVFENLPRYDSADGHAYKYTIQEKPVMGYASVITGTQDTGFTVTNTITGKVSVGVTKRWIGKPADQIMVYLMRQDQRVDTAVLSESNHWQTVFTDLDQYDSQGQAIQYSVVESVIDGYDTLITGDMDRGFEIVNTNLETMNIPIEKKWVGPAQESVKVSLIKDGTEVISVLHLTAQQEWKGVFQNVPVYDDKDGHVIQYSIEETALEGYGVTIQGDPMQGFTITNINEKTRNISVLKRWKGKEAASIELHLLADGKQIQKVVLTSLSNWQYQFEGLPVYDKSDGHLIGYTLEEAAMEGYTVQMEGNMDEGFKITNIQDLTAVKKNDKHVKTSSVFQKGLYLSLLVNAILWMMILSMYALKHKN